MTSKRRIKRIKRISRLKRMIRNNVSPAKRQMARLTMGLEFVKLSSLRMEKLLKEYKIKKDVEN